MITCVRCGREFAYDKAGPRPRFCAECRKQHDREYAREWQRANRQRRIMQLRARDRERYARLRAVVAERRRLARQRDPDAARARALARYYRLDPAKKRARNRSRRGDTVSDAYGVVLSRDPCCYCGAASEHVDHIIPIVAGGSRGWHNLTAACASCNRGKHAASLLEFLCRQRQIDAVG